VGEVDRVTHLFETRLGQTLILYELLDPAAADEQPALDAVVDEPRRREETLEQVRLCRFEPVGVDELAQESGGVACLPVRPRPPGDVHEGELRGEGGKGLVSGLAGGA
jgi:hypothetical protein